MKRKNVSSIMVGQIPFQRSQPQGKMVQRSIGKGLCVTWEVCSVKSVLWVLGSPYFFCHYFCCLNPLLDHLQGPNFFNFSNILFWLSLGCEWILEERCHLSDQWATRTSLGLDPGSVPLVQACHTTLEEGDIISYNLESSLSVWDWDRG